MVGNSYCPWRGENLVHRGSLPNITPLVEELGFESSLAPETMALSTTLHYFFPELWFLLHLVKLPYTSIITSHSQSLARELPQYIQNHVTVLIFSALTFLHAVSFPWITFLLMICLFLLLILHVFRKPSLTTQLWGECFCHGHRC